MKSFTLFFSFAALAAALLFGCAPSPVGSYQSAATYDRVLFSDTANEAFRFQGAGAQSGGGDSRFPRGETGKCEKL